MITKYLISVLAIISVLAVGYSWYVDRKLDRREAEIERLENMLSNCSARVRNILEDAQDDATVDDPSLFDVPDGWLMPSPGAGSGGD